MIETISCIFLGAVVLGAIALALFVASVTP